MITTLYQLEQAIAFVSGEDEDKDLSKEIGFLIQDSFISTDGEQMPAGLYCYDPEYPDEGCIFLEKIPS